MQKLIAILQIKSYNYADFLMWLKWYNDFIKCDEIYICDDESPYDLTQLINQVNPNIKYIKMKDLHTFGPTRQIQNIEKIFTIANPNKNDIIILPDNDEFWWFDKNKFDSFKDCVNDYKIKLENPDAIYVPWTLMRSKEPMKHRKETENFAECFQYRCNIKNCEHKPILFYKGHIDTSFHCGYKNGKTITEPTNLYYHSKCVYDLPLRCYHFRFTTIDEYERKQDTPANKGKRRSYFNTTFLHQIFNGEDQNDKYDIKDLTVYETYRNLK